MATIDSAAKPWNDGAGGCCNQRAPRIVETKRQKNMEKKTVSRISATGAVPKNDFCISSETASAAQTTQSKPTSTSSTNKNSLCRSSSETNSSENIKSNLNLNTQSMDESQTNSCREDTTKAQSDNDKSDLIKLTKLSENVEKLKVNDINVIDGGIDTGKYGKSDTSSNNRRISDSDQDLADEHHHHSIDNDDIDADIDEEDELQIRKKVVKPLSVLRMGTTCSSSSIKPQYVTHEIKRAADVIATRHCKIMQSQSQSEILPPGPGARGMIPKIQSLESRPIYPNVPYSPYGSPYGSPRSNRRRAPLRESRRVSIEQSGSFLQLNQYKLMDQIGQGSYGLVKLAYSEEDSTHYAMKILSKRKLLRKAGLMGRGPKKTTSPLDRVYREIAVLKKLDHPNVVKLIEVLDDPLEDSLYLVFELVQQGEVLSIPTDRPLSEERAWCVFRDALQGLEYLHYQRIIHADIKPGNLLLAECGRVKIADLGVCNEFLGEDAAMNNGSTAGTPAFRAPETLIPGQHLYSGKAADIWALGATLYALVYGNVPFVASSVPAVYEKIKHDELHFPETPKISSDLRDLIENILMKDPSKRITLPQIKEHPWVTANGTCPLASEEENCRLVQINDEDISSVVKSIPKLDTLILIKTMLKNHSFQHPFSRGSISGRAPQRGGSRLERFTRAGRSNSAPGAYHLSDRQLSNENILPAVSESVPSSNNEFSDPSIDGC